MRAHTWNKGRIAATGAAVCAVAVTLSSCTTGTDDAAKEGAASAGYPVSVTNCGFTEKFDKAPERVIIMSGASQGEAAAMIELGLEKSVVANAQGYGVSDIPGMAAKIQALPKDGLKLNESADIPAEQILSRRPDLVISTWSGGFDPKSGFASREKLAQAGIRTLVTPVNCSYGKTGQVSDAEKKAYDGASVDSSFEMISLLGKVFGRTEQADKVIGQLKDKLKATADKVAGKPRKKMLVTYPDMSAMNSSGLPAVMSGGIYDSVVRAAGGEPTFANGGADLTASLSAEKLAKADVDVVVIGSSNAKTDAAAEAEKLFAAYPQWSASKTKTFVAVSDGAYVGPANADAVAKIAAAAYPDAK